MESTHGSFSASLQLRADQRRPAEGTGSILAVWECSWEEKVALPPRGQAHGVACPSRAREAFGVPAGGGRRECREPQTRPGAWHVGRVSAGPGAGVPREGFPAELVSRCRRARGGRHPSAGTIWAGVPARCSSRQRGRCVLSNRGVNTQPRSEQVGALCGPHTEKGPEPRWSGLWAGALPQD